MALSRHCYWLPLVSAEAPGVVAAVPKQGMLTTYHASPGEGHPARSWQCNSRGWEPTDLPSVVSRSPGVPRLAGCWTLLPSDPICPAETIIDIKTACRRTLSGLLVERQAMSTFRINGQWRDGGTGAQGLHSRPRGWERLVSACDGDKYVYVCVCICVYIYIYTYTLREARQHAPPSGSFCMVNYHYYPNIL